MRSALWLLAIASSAADDGCSPEARLRDYAPGELGFVVYTEQENHLHLSCYAAGNNMTIVQKTTTEFQRAQVGISSREPDEDASYPCSNQDSYGQLNLEVMEVNGFNAYEGGAQSISAGDATCRMSGGRGFYDGSVKITQVVSDHLTIDAYMFKSSKEQAAANLQHTMTIGAMDACKMELVYAFKPKAGGGLEARVEVRQHAFGDLEDQVNAAMTAEIDDQENRLSIFIPANMLLAGGGHGPSGCGSTFSDNTEKHRLIDVSTVFTCGSTGAVVTGTVDWQDQTLTLSLSSEEAPESCNVLYWDPLVRPMEVATSTLELSASGADSARPLAPCVGLIGLLATVGAWQGFGA